MFFGPPDFRSIHPPRINSKPAWPVRDVVLIDLARHAAMKAPFTLDHIERDTAELHDVLKVKADELGAKPDAWPESALDVLEPFALEWARNRAAERAANRQEIHHG